MGEGCVGQVKLRRKRDCLFGADVRAESTLQAGVFLEPQLRQIGVIAKRTRGAKRDASQAQRAGVSVDDHCAVRRALWKGDVFDVWVERLGGQAGDLPPRAQRQDRGRKCLGWSLIKKVIGERVRISNIKKRDFVG